MIFKDNNLHTNVLERLSQLAELAETLLHYSGGPLVHSVVLIGISSNGCFY